MHVFSEEELQQITSRLLLAAGADEEEATTVSRSLVEANLYGHDSHGVMRLPFYIDRMQQGILKQGSRLQILNETPSAILADGGWGFGQVVARDLVNRLIKKAETVGVASGSLKQSAHIGRLGEYAEMATEAGMIALICANNHGAIQRVAPVGGKRPRLGTNPLCIGVPGGEHGAFVLDFGTSATAEGKVRVKKIAGEQIPDGWILDSNGEPTNDPNKLYEDPPGSILPMGGLQAYKGFGLAFMIEMIASGLAGAPCAQPDAPSPLGNAAWFLVISPEKMAGSDHLVQEVRQLEEYVRSVPKIDGVDKITLPGDPERRIHAERKANGIPIDDGNWKAMLDLAEKLNVKI
ncbi:putative oxidoreductase YbiC [Polystyrenella longa]|uniref:Putative oxidoreductase YbiC n=1 Tax=Polystyrenella longa TaxID=2528007 RepID=A0A518CJN7_9PLAN|nr:Ldh family oxidoreductase [Polystyrenella longa]QDU79443.1 putative oxidoreductase YbiC [Polystyrenella longa]